MNNSNNDDFRNCGFVQHPELDILIANAERQEYCWNRYYNNCVRSSCCRKTHSCCCSTRSKLLWSFILGLFFFSIVCVYAVWTQFPLQAGCVVTAYNTSTRINSTSNLVRPLEFNGLRLNQVSNFGTHNSYHTSSFLPIPPWKYTMPSITDQLNQGARLIEFDVHRARGDWTVYHVPLLDYGSTSYCLCDNLQAVRKWMDENPCHFPITIVFEPKYAFDFEQMCLQPDQGSLFVDLESTILKYIPIESIVRPVDMRGNYTDVRTAILERGWPSINSTRGKVFLYFDFWTENHLCRSVYNSIPFDRRLFFQRRSTDDALGPAPTGDAAIVEMQNINDHSEKLVVNNGFIVRSLQAMASLSDSAAKSGVQQSIQDGIQLISMDKWTDESIAPHRPQCNGISPSSCKTDLAQINFDTATCDL